MCFLSFCFLASLSQAGAPFGGTVSKPICVDRPNIDWKTNVLDFFGDWHTSPQECAEGLDDCSWELRGSRVSAKCPRLVLPLTMGLAKGDPGGDLFCLPVGRCALALAWRSCQQWVLTLMSGLLGKARSVLSFRRVLCRNGLLCFGGLLTANGSRKKTTPPLLFAIKIAGCLHACPQGWETRRKHTERFDPCAEAAWPWVKTTKTILG